MVCPSTLLVEKLNIRENSDFWKGYVVKSLIELKSNQGGGYQPSSVNFFVSTVDFGTKLKHLEVETWVVDIELNLMYNLTK